MSELSWGPFLAVGGGFGLFLVSYALSVNLVPWVRTNAVRLGLLDLPGARKVHRVPTPLGGGIAVFVATNVPIVGGLVVAWLLRDGAPDWVPALLARHLPGLLSKASSVLVIVGGGVVLFALGLVDDRTGLGPRIKLAVQVAVALSVALLGVRVSLFVEAPWFGVLVTVGWVVLVTNSFNLLDNMDGLTSGVALIAALLFFWVAVQTGQWFVACYLLVLAGATAGFLRHNFPPATIFLGDAGSLFIGYQISILTVVSTFYESRYTVFPVALPILILAVPLFDTASVVWIRWREGRPIFVGDKKHLSHRFVEAGMSPTEAVLVIYLLTLAAGIGAVILYRTDTIGAGLLLLQLLVLLAVVGLLERAGRRPG